MDFCENDSDKGLLLNNNSTGHITMSPSPTRHLLKNNQRFCEIEIETCLILLYNHHKCSKIFYSSPIFTTSDYKGGILL